MATATDMRVVTLSPRSNENTRAVRMVIADGEPVRTHVRNARAPCPAAGIANPSEPARGVAIPPSIDLILASVDRSDLLRPETAADQRPSLLK